MRPSGVRTQFHYHSARRRRIWAAGYLRRRGSFANALTLGG